VSIGMSDDSRIGGVRGRLRPQANGPAKVGDPNVLTGEAKPNRLSNETAPSKPIAVSASTLSTQARPGTSQTTQATQATPPRTWTPSAPRPQPIPVQADEPARRRISLPTLIFLGFLALTGFRLLNEFAQSFGDSTPTPTPAAAVAATPRPAGPVTFGTDMSDSCEISGQAASFTNGTDVWWLARMPTRQSKDAIVVVRVLFEGDQIVRDVWPPDGTTFWTVMCDGPVSQDKPGSYRVEVWNEDETVLQATGEYEVR
jgi:hypothetical protein